MESNLKDRSVSSKARNRKKMKESWSYDNRTYGEDSFLGGVSWPPRSYTCSFCRREFRSAQALGGHMNIHRRDRARLRQSPPPRDSDHRLPPLNLNLNPNPNFSTYTLPSSLVSAPHFATSSPYVSRATEIKKFDHDRDFMTKKHGYKLVKKAKILRLDLEIGCLVDDRREDLDLELRLGYS